MSNSRTKNVSINMSVALFCQVINLILNFVSRTIFIKTLGADYLGVNGLFSNVLSILSFAELGIGNAIIFSMYKPLAEHDEDKLASLMLLYKKAYRIILTVVVVAGVSVIPFLDYVIKGEPKVSENLVLLYLLFLSNTAISYVAVYKKSIIYADQKNYIILLATEATHILQILLQMYVLYKYRSFIAFLVIQIVCTLAGNIICSIVANKKYPFLTQEPAPLAKSERRNVFQNIKAMAMYKLGSIVLNSTDNILVSAMLGVTPVGYVSNYVLLHSACNSILGNITSSFTASVGNLNVVGSEEHKYNIFNRILLITVWLYGFATIGLIVISKYLIHVWVGDEYILDNVTVVAIMFGFYVAGVHAVESNYRTTMGYFVKGRWAPGAAAFINIVLSIVFCKWIGLAGIFIATPIARMSAIGIVDTILIYKNGFNKSPWIYYGKNFMYLIVLVIICILCMYLVSLVSIEGWLGVIIQCAIVTFVYNGLMFLVFFRTSLFKDIVSMVVNLIKK